MELLTNNEKKISFVIPSLNEAESLPKLIDGIRANVPDGYLYEIIIVNDGATDNTEEVMCCIVDADPAVHLISHRKNFGKAAALETGFHESTGDIIITMDDDMQTHPSQVFKLIETIEEGGYDVVYGTYPHSKNSFFKTLSSKFNRMTSEILLDMPKEIVATNFWIITREVRDEVIKYSSFNPVLDAIFYQVTHNFGSVEVEHYKRESGKSGYTFKKLVRLWLSYWNYSVVPLRISFFIGAASATFGILVTIWLIYKKITDPTIPMGWASTLCLMTLLFGAVLMVLGVVGEYLGKAILILNKTPQFIVRESINLDNVVPDSGSHTDKKTQSDEEPAADTQAGAGNSKDI